MLYKSTFRCKRCGACCRGMTIKLMLADVDTLKRLSLKESSFLRADPLGSKNKVLQKRGNDCIFLEKRDNLYFCKVYNSRPKICRDYPFFGKDKIKSCKPLFSIN